MSERVSIPTMTPLRLVLVEPENPANIGFIARLCANFGVTDWVAVRPPSLGGTDAEKTGAPALESLAALQTADSLTEALADCSHAVGFTARQGKYRRPMPVTDLAGLGQEWGPTARPALVFGREDRGLETSEVEQCQAVVGIATFGLNSFNLSHAVAIALHEWHRLSVDTLQKPEFLAGAEEAWSTQADRARIQKEIAVELEASDFPDGERELGAALRRWVAHPLESRDLWMIQKIVRHARWLRKESAGTEANQ